MMQRRPPPPSGPPDNKKTPAPSSTSSSLSPPKAANTTFNENQFPSVKSGFYTIEQERTIRSKTCRFITEAGKVLNLPPLTYYTAMVMFQRFYAVHSFKDHDRFEITVACILLAAKTEESPKKLTTVIQECHRLKTNSAKKSGNKSGSKNGSLDVNSQEFIRLKERTLLLERVILHTIGFELSIDHPHKFLTEQVKRLVKSKQIEFAQPPPAENPNRIQEVMIKSLLQQAISFTNDSMFTSLCLQYPANEIASTAVYMSIQANKMRPTNNRSWLELDIVRDLGVANLLSIAKQISELISSSKNIHKGIFSTIESNLKSMEQGKISGANDGGSAERDNKRQRT